KTARAVATITAIYLIGLVGVFGLSSSGAMKADLSSPGTVVIQKGRSQRVVVETTHVTRPIEEVACGNRINKYVYPLDVMLPLIDLGQESRCDISSTHTALGIAKGGYQILGWIVTSCLILTVSGVVRRRIEG